MRLKKNQQGLSFITISLIFGVFVFFLLTGLKIYPGYYEYFSVKTSMEGLKGDSNLGSMNKKDIWLALEKRFEINMVNTVKMEHLTVELDKKTKKRNIRLNYEYRVPLYGNVDAVLKFDTSIISN